MVPHCQISDLLLPVDCLIAVGDQAYHRHVVSKLDDGVGVVHGHAVVGEQRVQEHTPLMGPRVEGQHAVGVGFIAYPHYLGPSRQEVQDPVAEGGVQSQGPQLGDEFRRGLWC